jgi:uncharacterized protein YjbJ (UPF0337 family)
MVVDRPACHVRPGVCGRYPTDEENTMTTGQWGGEPLGGSTGQAGMTDVAREQSAQVAGTAKEQVGHVAETSREQVGEVVSEAASQARDLAGELRSQVTQQAGTQRDRLVQSLQALGQELDEMSGRGTQSGVASEVARQVAGRTRDVAAFIDGREPGDLLEQTKTFARQRPGAFLLGAAALGVLAGRLTRGVTASSGSAPTVGQPPERMSTGGRHADDVGTGTAVYAPVPGEQVPVDDGEFLIGTRRPEAYGEVPRP